MSTDRRDQLWAFLALIAAILILGLAPIVTAGFMGKTLPDSLIAVSDKTVTGLVGVLGTLAGMIFRLTRADEAATENTGKAFDAIAAASATTPPLELTPDVMLRPGETAQAEGNDNA